MLQHTILIYILPIWVFCSCFPLYTAENNIVVFRCSESQQGLFWTVAPATNTVPLASGYITKIKHSFLLNCEKLLLVRGKELPSSWIAESSQSAHSWLSLCEGWAMEALKKCHGSYEFKWQMFFIMGSATIRSELYSRKSLGSSSSKPIFILHFTH